MVTDPKLAFHVPMVCKRYRLEPPAVEILHEEIVSSLSIDGAYFAANTTTAETSASVRTHMSLIESNLNFHTHVIFPYKAQF